MSATQFTDDAYNKFHPGGGRSGTLIGNWYEERSIRDSTGEGRSVPQRHIPRSGLLMDFTKVPSSGPRKQDNTFERVYGPKMFAKHVPQSKAIGAGEEDLTGEKPIAETLQAEGRVARVGPRELATRMARAEAAEAEVCAEEGEVERKRNERFFDTTTGSYHTKPDETVAQKAEFERTGCAKELLHGPKPDRTRALNNAGLEIRNHIHYSNIEPVTFHRMALDNKLLRNDMAASAATGVTAFGKNAQFTTPCPQFLKGLQKDHEMQKMIEGLESNQPCRQIGGAAPRGHFAAVPSLTALKDAICNRLRETWGEHAYVSLRQRLYDVSDHEGFASKNDVIIVFREQLGLTEEDVDEKALGVYIDGLITTKRTDVRVSALMSSLRPMLTQAAKRRVMQAFTALEPTNGSVKLGAWLSRLGDDNLKRILITAFGAEEEEAVTDMPLTEPVFLELISDLAPFADIEALLA
eukprot:gnl/TRDRNA2_/TRDRNA2_178471_c0_seq1.p1 gnl/TRDRNA2_/TRDRNA2_178471_c0~~gnl/TRDRNA2_/TRDRNA2_178471_c0_seq1.p1  ORF type:complete len:497 (+),score=98.27 gnl/TRDRNA2_/TRDRNA2_178471_c0_seq1:94-1491(+)